MLPLAPLHELGITHLRSTNAPAHPRTHVGTQARAGEHAGERAHMITPLGSTHKPARANARTHADEDEPAARDKAQRQPRWRPVSRLVEQSDDVADALEEAAFLIGLIADHHLEGWNDDVRKVLARLAATVLQATQDQVKALAIARTLGANSEAVDNDAFLGATWRVLQAERQCDGYLRDARRVILGAVQDAPSLMLANDLAATLELASDRLLTAAYALRDLAFDKAGVRG